MFGNKEYIFGSSFFVGFLWILILCGLPHEGAAAYLCCQTSCGNGEEESSQPLTRRWVFPDLPSLHYLTVWSNWNVLGAIEEACLHVGMWYLRGWNSLQTKQKLCRQRNERNLMWGRWFWEMVRFIIYLKSVLLLGIVGTLTKAFRTDEPIDGFCKWMNVFKGKKLWLKSCSPQQWEMWWSCWPWHCFAFCICFPSVSSLPVRCGQWFCCPPCHAEPTKRALLCLLQGSLSCSL